MALWTWWIWISTVKFRWIIPQILTFCFLTEQVSVNIISKICGNVPFHFSHILKSSVVYSSQRLCWQAEQGVLIQSMLIICDKEKEDVRWFGLLCIDFVYEKLWIKHKPSTCRSPNVLPELRHPNISGTPSICYSVLNWESRAIIHRLVVPNKTYFELLP